MFKLRHKYGAKPTTIEGIRYDSKKEAAYAGKLELLKKSGELLFYLRQVPVHLPGNIIYRIDFLEFWAPKGDSQGDVIFTDVKGFMTPVSKIKIAQAEEILGVKINIV